MKEGEGFINIEIPFDEDKEARDVIQKEVPVPLKIDFDRDDSSSDNEDLNYNKSDKSPKLKS